MAESRNTVAIVPLNGQNYGTWRVQAKMVLLKEGLWGIVQGTEAAPDGDTAATARFIGCRDKALAMLGLSIDPTLLWTENPNRRVFLDSRRLVVSSLDQSVGKRGK